MTILTYRVPSRVPLLSSRAAMGAILFCSVALTASAGKVTLGKDGIGIDGGNMGGFGIGFPALNTGGGDQKPIETRVENGTATVKYAGGITLSMTVEGGGKVALRFKGDTSSLKSFRLDGLMIPFNYSDGGTWSIGGGDAKPFPTQKPAKPFLFQGNASTFEFASVNGKKIKIEVPAHTYQQLQDNREWGWKIFQWWCSSPFNGGWSVHYINVSFDASDEKSVKLVDRFGQTTRKEYPGKVKSERDLKDDAATEAEYYASMNPAQRDAFGGLLGSKRKYRLDETGYFHVEKKGQKWILVDPEGNAFFHLGICSFSYTEDYTYVEGREDTYEWLPPHDSTFGDAWHTENWWNPRAVSFFKANVIRKYGRFNDAECIGRMVDRIRQFGFNSIGAFSGSGVFDEKAIPYVSHLPIGLPAVPGVRGVFDPFDEGNLSKLDADFARSIASRADNRLIIGYFLENEQGFEDLPRAVPALDGKHACKRRLVRMLEEKYRRIGSFNSAWGTNAGSFDELANQGLPLQTKDAFSDMQAFDLLFLEAYFKAIADTFHKYDSNHMLIGNRWQPGTANSEALCRVAGKYNDVISINYYTSGIDAAFIRRIYDWTGRKPQMWSEFYYTSDKESNVNGGGHDVATQKERGLAYRNYVEGAAALGFVVGIEWFTLTDQAVTGRFFEKYNGERANTGIFNVADRPYKSMVTEMAKTNASVYDVWLEGKSPYLFDHPRFSGKGGNAAQVVQAGRSIGRMKIDGQLGGWPKRPPVMINGDRLVLGRESGGLEAAFKACWDDENLYLLVNVTDKTPMKNAHGGGNLWSADGIEIFFGSEQLERGGAFLFTDKQVLIGGGKAGQCHVVNAAQQPAIETAVVPSVDGTGYTIEAAIPWSALSVKAPKEGTQFLFDLGVDDSENGSDRRCQLMWNGIARNSSDRGAWGRLELAR